MIGFEFRIKSVGATAGSDPLTFSELRELLHAGLVSSETLLADDDFAYHPLRAYPVLWDALHDPTVVDVVRAPVTRLAPREERVRERDANTPALILEPTEADLVDFEAVRKGERGFSALDVLALNRAKEAPAKPVRMTKWWRRSRMVDLRRWLTYGFPLIVICALTGTELVKKLASCGGGLVVVPLLIVFSLSFFPLILLWGYFFLVDYDYPGKN